MSCGAKNHGGGNSGDSGMSVCENGMDFHSGLKPIFFFPPPVYQKTSTCSVLISISEFLLKSPDWSTK